MTNRFKPGPGIGPTWKGLIQSGELRRMSLVEAIGLATDAHAGTIDKAGRPYIEHPLRVMDAMGTDVERMIAVLHDVLEDTLVTVDELHTRGCPPEVVEAVEVLTKRAARTTTRSSGGSATARTPTTTQR
jgi:(p)ppGpp synthase/HD superfamily hydrolase